MKKILSIVTLLFLGGCGMAPSPSPVPQTPVAVEGKVTVVTTIYPLAYLAQRIVGDSAEVINIIPVGTEPHAYEPTPNDVARVRSADFFLYNGAGMDSWADKIVTDGGARNIAILRASDGVALLDGHYGTDPDHGDEEEHSDVVSDPHFWLDFDILIGISGRIRDSLVRINPDQKDLYVRRTQELIDDLKNLDARYTAELKTCRLRMVVTSHAALGYVARRYSFAQIPVAGISPEQEPSLARMREVTDLIRDNSVRFLFFETLVSPKISQTLAAETGAEALVFDPLEGLTEANRVAGNDFLSIMTDNLENLKKGMECGG